MSVTITPELQTYIDWLKSDSRITDVSISEVPSEYLPQLPVSVTNPLQFTLTLVNSATNIVLGWPTIRANNTYTCQIVLPDRYYGMPIQPGWSPPVDSLWPFVIPVKPRKKGSAIKDKGDINFGIDQAYVVGYPDPAKQGTWHPLLGFDSTPADLETVDPQLKSLVEKISTVTNISIYKYLSPTHLEKFNTDEAYYGWCYIGTDTSVTSFIGGKDSIGIAITKTDYLSTGTHQYIVDYIADRIPKYKRWHKLRSKYAYNYRPIEGKT